MSARSLYAFENPTGQIGSQYTAVSPTSTGISPPGGNLTIAQFFNLPIGVYAISGKIQLTTTLGSTIDSIFISQSSIGGIGLDVGSSIILTRTTITTQIGSPIYFNSVISITPSVVSNNIGLIVINNTAIINVSINGFTATKLA